MAKKKRFKGTPLDPKDLEWALGLSLVYKIDTTDLQEDDPEADGELDTVDEQALAFEEGRDLAQPRQPPGSEQVRHREEEAQRATDKLVAQVALLEQLAVRVRMMAPAGCAGIDTLAQAWRSLEALSTQLPATTAGQIELAKACKAFKERAEALQTLFTSHPHDEEAVAWALQEQGKDPLCKGVVSDLSNAVAAEPPDTQVYAAALLRLDAPFTEAREQRAIADELLDALGTMLEPGPYLLPKALLEQMRKEQERVTTALARHTVRAVEREVRLAIQAIRVAAVKHGLSTRTCVTLPETRGMVDIRDAMFKISDTLSAGGWPFKKEKKKALEALMLRADKLERGAAGSADFSSLAPAIVQLALEVQELGGNVKSDKTAKTQAYAQKSNLSPILRSVANLLAPTERGRMLTQAIKDIRTQPAWYDAAIEFIAGRLADGRPDHVHLAGGGNTLLNNGTLLLGFITCHLDSSAPNKRKANQVFGRKQTEDNIVEVAVQGGVIKEIVPDPVV